MNPEELEIVCCRCRTFLCSYDPDTDYDSPLLHCPKCNAITSQFNVDLMLEGLERQEQARHLTDQQILAAIKGDLP